MKIESSRQTFIKQTNERTLAFTGLLTEPKNYNNQNNIYTKGDKKLITFGSSLTYPCVTYLHIYAYDAKVPTNSRF